jgi:hypothetical protein
VPDEENRLRMQLWEQQRWAYIIERRLQEEHGDAKQVDDVLIF